MTTAYLNGQYLALSEARISPMDRGFLFGDGIYEVIPSYQGKTVGLNAHLARMKRGLAALSIDPDMDDEAWRTVVATLIEKNRSDIPEGNIGLYLHVSRGADTRRFHAYPTNVTPTVFAFAFAIAPPQPLRRELAKPLFVALEEDLRWQRCHIKSTSLLGNVMHFQQAAASGLHETILFNREQEVTEASSSNVFMVKDGVIYTPPLDNQLLPGITRALVLEALNAGNFTVREQVFSVQALLDADEVWLTSSSKEIAPVGRVGDTIIGDGQPGPVWEAAINAYHRMKFDA
ncbi:aminotransferase class IV [Alteromonas sp. CYL-A6]|uniref:aminotransferase class IV n=1 Tax=Alteromonas nitratireducens TaxID=3390813 RepID=UPI0034A82340